MGKIYCLTCLFLISLSSIGAYDLPLGIHAGMQLHHELSAPRPLYKLEEKAAQLVHANPAYPCICVQAGKCRNSLQKGGGFSEVTVVCTLSIAFYGNSDGASLQLVAEKIQHLYGVINRGYIPDGLKASCPC
ncbi:hypothetical protein D770_24415 [Flammeovirgaceae bacterium 311]|nr:hypothetical protein D770_24415 [Flammeovirgaceae bacterium 311]